MMTGEHVLEGVHTTLTTEHDLDCRIRTWLRASVSRAAPVPVLGPADEVVTEGETEALLQRIDFHGLAGLVSAALPGTAPIPDAFRQGLRARVVEAEIREAEHAEVLRAALDALAGADIRPLVLKGTGLAYRHYDHPAQRIRGDTDLLVARTDFDRAVRALEDIGGEVHPMPAGLKEATAQHIVFRTPIGRSEDLDLHFALSGHVVLRDLFDYHRLLETAGPVPALSPHAWTVSDVEMLLITAFHRLKHRQSVYYVNGVRYLSIDRMIWAADMHFLSKRLSEADWEGLLQRAAETGLSGALLSGLVAAEEAFDTEVPPWVTARLLNAKPGRASEFLMAGVVGQVWMNFQATPGLSVKLRFLWTLLLPPADRMREAFRDVRPAWLPWLYLYRAGRGTSVLIRRYAEGPK